MGEHQGGDGYLNAEGLASGLLGDPVAIYPYQRKELALVWLGETLLCQCLVCSLSPAHACHRSLCWVCLPSPHGWCCGCLLQNVIAEHEIRNISCAAQDPEDLCTFAYITKDLQTSHHYCHVFSTVDVNLTYEIILTLGQAFEVAYQLALQAQRAKPLGAAAGETIETKSSKPVPKPRAGVRKSALEPPEVDQDSQSHASVSWVVDPKQDSKRTLSTKYETTIF